MRDPAAATTPTTLTPPLADDTPATPPPAPTSAKGFKKVSFGGIKKKEETKTSYPVFNPAPESHTEAALIAARIIERTAKVEALEGALKTDKAELRLLVNQFYYTANQGKLEPASSVAIRTFTEQGIPADEVLVTFQNRYGRLESEAPVVAVLGEQADDYFRQSFEFKLDGDKIPTERAQELVDELQTLLARFNALEALEVKDFIKPVPDFHTKRHSLFSPEINLQLDQACPVTAVVKTKGRK
jgi:hypothetical protein